MTTFDNIRAQITDLKKEFGVIFGKKPINTLSILPMNHLFELTVGFASFLNMGYSIYYSDNLRPKNVLSVIKNKKIKFMCTVPSFFKMLKLQFESDVAKQSKFKRFMYQINYHYIAKYLPFKPLKKFLFRNFYEYL